MYKAVFGDHILPSNSCRDECYLPSNLKASYFEICKPCQVIEGYDAGKLPPNSGLSYESRNLIVILIGKQVFW